MIIAQISDTHIMPKGQEWKSIPETDVTSRLKLIVKSLNALDPKPDVVLLTGDATDNGEIEAYSHLKEILKPLSIPIYIVPGNHDDREAMRTAFQHELYMPDNGFIHYVIDDYPVRLIALDSVIEHKPEGLLCEDRIAWLQAALENNIQKPTLIFMHHPLIKCGQKLLDKLRCHTPGDFENLMSRFPNIIGIVSGHYHKSCATIFGKSLCFVAPSVAPVHYFEKASDEHTNAIELVRPSFVLHKWAAGFNLLSEVVQAIELENRVAFHKEPNK